MKGMRQGLENGRILLFLILVGASLFFGSILFIISRAR
jgi:hypothetical protein